MSWKLRQEHVCRLGFLTIVRLDSEDMLETVTVEPDAPVLETLMRALDEPVLRMLTIITAVNGESSYAATGKERGVKFVGDGGKVMTADLSSTKDEISPEDKLSAIDGTFAVQVEEQGGCCTVQIMAGEKLASTGKTTVKNGIATFDGIYTEMEFQRRGLATCVMGFLVRWARANGAQVGLLNASPFGQKLYHGTGWTAIYNVVSMGGEPVLGFSERMRQKYAPKQ